MGYTKAEHFSKKDKSSINDISTNLVLQGPIPLKSTDFRSYVNFGPDSFFPHKKAPTLCQYSTLAPIKFPSNDAIKYSTCTRRLIGQKLDEGQIWVPTKSLCFFIRQKRFGPELESELKLMLFYEKKKSLAGI